MPLSQDMILNPLIEQYGQHIIKQEDRKLQTRVNVADFEQIDGEQVNIDKHRIFPTYENLTLEEPKVEYHEQYDVHELVFPINEEDTTIFTSDVNLDLSAPDKFTFYKSKEGNLIIGELPFVELNALVSDFTDDQEDVMEDIQQLPPLQ